MHQISVEDSRPAARSETGAPPASTPHLVRISQAAEITGLPASLLRKSFMSEEKRPKNVPSPPPHKRIGRAIYIIAEELPAWIGSLDRSLAGSRHSSGPAGSCRAIRRR